MEPFFSYTESSRSCRWEQRSDLRTLVPVTSISTNWECVSGRTHWLQTVVAWLVIPTVGHVDSYEQRDSVSPELGRDSVQCWPYWGNEGSNRWFFFICKWIYFLLPFTFCPKTSELTNFQIHFSLWSSSFLTRCCLWLHGSETIIFCWV